ncbi:MAG: hypothetical protein AAB490_06155 [Patescibacteria group bacterium]
MKNFTIILIESVILSLLYWFKLPAPLSWILLIVFYFSVGFIHGRIFKKSVLKAFLCVVVVGALAGILLTIVNVISTAPAAGESRFTWLPFGLFVSIISYSLLPSLIVMYLAAFIGIKVSSAIGQKKILQ